MLFGQSLHHGPVAFVDCSRTNHLIEPHQRLAGFREQHRSADRPVDTVYDTEENIPGFVVAAADESFYFVFEACLPLGVGLHQIAGVLVYHQQVVVFVEYVFFAEHFRFV